MEGAFDEAESHNSFLQALNAWRGVPQQNTSKEVKFADKKPGSFFAQLGNESNWNVDCLPQFTEGGTKPDTEI